MISGVYTAVVHRIVREDFLVVFVDIGTHMRLDLLGSAEDVLAAPASACVAGKV